MKKIACLLFVLLLSGCNKSAVELWSTDHTTPDGTLFRVFEQSDANANMHNCQQEVAKIKAEMPKRFSWCKIVEDEKKEAEQRKLKQRHDAMMDRLTPEERALINQIK